MLEESILKRGRKANKKSSRLTSRCFTTCETCSRMSVRQNPTDLTLLENSCKSYPFKGKYCKVYQMRNRSFKRGKGREIFRTRGWIARPEEW